MTKKRMATSVSVAVSGALLLTACAEGASPEAAGSAGDAEYEPVTIESCGHTETFESPPERVVVNATSLVEELAALGVSDRVVGYAPVSAFNPLEEYEDAVADTPKLGDGALSREVVVEQDPDLFYSQLNYDDNMVEQYEPLDIPVLFPRKACDEDVPQDSDGDLDFIASRYQDVAELGQIFDVADEAEELIESLKADMSDVREEAADQDPVTVANVGFYSGVDKPFNAAEGEGIVDELIDVAGGTNVYGDLTSGGNSSSEMNPESLIERRPEVIIIRDLPSYGGGFEEVREFLLQDPRFSDIPAVQNDRFTHIKVEEWYAGIQFPNAAARFAETFHASSS